MLWSLPACLLLLGVHLSAAVDMVTVTTVPGAPEAAVTKEAEAPTTEKPKVKPTIRALHITSNITYRYAQTLVSCRVINPSDQAAEASFHLTLPESAFIAKFLMEVKGKVYEAYVKEKKEAKAVYDQAVQAGQSAGHVALDARDSNLFTVSVNLEAQEKVTFNLTYEQLLSRNLGVYSNIINIDPQQIVKDMSVKVIIEEPTAITTLEVPELQTSNEAIPDQTKQNALAKIEEISKNHKQVVWAPTPEQQKAQSEKGLSGQFIVKYDVDREENPQQILVDEGYFVHFFAPDKLPKLKKHVVFVLDFSGSMGGRKLEQLQEAMGKILSDMDANDYFSIVIFESIVKAWSPDKIYSTAIEHLPPWQREQKPELLINTTLDRQFVIRASSVNIDLARSYLKNYTDLGGTNIMGGLRTGLELVSIGSDLWANESDPPQPVVIFLTDGQPNVEVYDTDTIINNTKHLNVKQSPIFSLAFGYGADFNFLRKLSLGNHGFARNIYEASDASAQLTNFYRSVASPLLSNVTFSYLPGQVDNSSNTRTGFPVFFSGSEIVVAGKINKDSVKDKETIGELSGVTATGLHKYPIIIDIVKPQNRTLGHLEKTWAYLQIQQLLDKADSLDDSEQKNKTNEKALAIALQYSFVTPLTSLVVVKPNQSESAVDTTQLKPGNDLALGNYGSQFSSASAGFGASSAAGAAGYGGGSYAVPQMSFISAARPALSISSMDIYPSTPFNYQPQATSAPESDETPIVPEANFTKVPLSEIKWLQQYLTNSTSSGNITVSVQGHEHILALNQTDQSFGACQVNNKSGECHHFQYCALNIFKDDVSVFIPYQCATNEGFLTVCCPENVS